jgi:hypothetical protein
MVGIFGLILMIIMIVMVYNNIEINSLMVLFVIFYGSMITNYICIIND